MTALVTWAMVPSESAELVLALRRWSGRLDWIAGADPWDATPDERNEAAHLAVGVDTLADLAEADQIILGYRREGECQAEVLFACGIIMVDATGRARVDYDERAADWRVTLADGTVFHAPNTGLARIHARDLLAGKPVPA